MHSLEGGAITSLIAQGNPRVSLRKSGSERSQVFPAIFPTMSFTSISRLVGRIVPQLYHNYRYVIIICIDGTQGGAASTNPRLKRGKVTRWNAWFRKERPPVKRFGCVSVCSIACFRLSNFLLLLLDPPISGEIISRRCGWAFHIFRGERGFFSVNKFDEVFDPVFINNWN